MSHLDQTKKTHVDLTEGYTWYATLSVTRFHAGRRQVFFDQRRTEGNGRLTIGLDQRSKLRVWLADESGTRVQTDCSDVTIAKAFLLRVQLRPAGPQRTGLICSVRRNFDPPDETTFEPFQLWKGNAEIRVGASWEGAEAASFSLAEMMFFARVVDPIEDEKIWTYSRERYDLS